MRQHRLGTTRILLAVALVTSLSGCATISPQTQPLSATSVEVVDGAWEAMPQSPLSPRGGAAAVWTGDHLLLLGGVRTDGEVAECPPSASCLGPPQTGLEDGAAWDPESRTWLHLRSSQPETPGRPGQLSSDPGAWSGTQVLTRNTAITPDFAVGTLASAAIDVGPALVYAAPVWTGRELVSVGWDYGGRASGVDGQLVAQVLDPATGQARSVPWPFDPPATESIRTAWTGKEVIAFVAVATPSGTGTRMVAFDPTTDTWRLVTDAIDLPFSVAWDGVHVQVLTEDRLLALDPTTGEVTSTTTLPDGELGTLLVSPNGEILLSGQHLHLLTASPDADPSAQVDSGQGKWRQLPELPSQVDTQERTTAWAGEQIVIWGGRASGIQGESSVNTAEGWILTPL